MKKSLWITALTSSVGTAIYIALVAFLMTNGNRLFGQNAGVLGGIGILLLFTLRGRASRTEEDLPHWHAPVTHQNRSS